MKKSLPQLLLAVPVLIAIILGYAIFQQFQEKKSSPDQDQQANTNTSPTVTRTSEELALLNVPGENATNDERREHMDKVLKEAKNGNTLNISGCTPDIVALRVKQGGKLTLVNKDPVNHSIVIDQDHSYSVPANSNTEITVDFGRGAGLYGYGCDRSGKAVGFFVVSE